MRGLQHEVFELVRLIPTGRVVGYGQLGKRCKNPVSGLIIGRMMAIQPHDSPWHRVVGADGSLKTEKRGPEHGLEQRRRLELEGVEFDALGRVKPEYFWEG